MNRSRQHRYAVRAAIQRAISETAPPPKSPQWQPEDFQAAPATETATANDFWEPKQ